MFYGCKALVSADFSNVDFQASDAYCMFDGCSQLKTLIAPSRGASPHLTDISRMFDGCSSLSSIDLPAWTSAIVKKAGFLFSGVAR